MKINIILGKTSSGKTTVLHKLCDLYNFNKIVTTTTRPMRNGEIEGKDYHFTSRLEFLDKAAKGMFIEWKSYDTLVKGVPDTWFYGTERKYLTENGFIIVDVQGAKSFINALGRDSLNIFYLEVDDQTIKDRAITRGDDLTELDRRLEDDNKKFTKKELEKIGAVVIPAYNNSTPVADILDRL